MASVRAIHDETCYRVTPFTRVREGDDVVIGPRETSGFLSVSPDVVAILDWLAEGRTVAETSALYERHYGEAEGMAETIHALAARGFLEPAGSAGGGPVVEDEGRSTGAALDALLTVAALLYRPWGLALQVGLLAVAGSLLWLDPTLLPGLRAIFFDEHVTLTSAAVIGLSLATLALHELAHMAAARRHGVRSRLGVGHRLWMPVVETDLSGLWALPRRKRLLPILAGPLADSVFSAGVVVVLYARQRGWIVYGELLGTVIEAILVISVLRILWQCLLFVRTDFYFALAHLLGCRSLMADTEAYLADLARAAIGRPGGSSLTRLPANERRVVRGYSVLWLLGRLLAMAFLVAVQLPLLVHYLRLFMSTLAAGPSSGVYALVDTSVMALFVLLTNGLGFGLWIHHLIRRRRTPNGDLATGTAG